MGNGSRALAYNKQRALSRHGAKGMAQGGIGGIVQRRGGIVQYEDIRTGKQGSGNGQPLLLSPGKVVASLFYRLFQPQGLSADKVRRLCRLQSSPELRFRSVLFAP